LTKAILFWLNDHRVTIIADDINIFSILEKDFNEKTTALMPFGFGFVLTF
jgi:hypothetical protein